MLRRFLAVGIGFPVLSLESLEKKAFTPYSTLSLLRSPIFQQRRCTTLLILLSISSLIQKRTYPSWFPPFACFGVDVHPLEEELSFSSFVLHLIDDLFDFPQSFGGRGAIGVVVPVRGVVSWDRGCG